ncbi:hypothetical protein QBC35DRAFT_450803 [Podospora australis]|uniref:TPR repeat-containing protein n=1 Tax=Podospora australis TaxID=1536484 RepID=A0AAN6WZN2_9PEZI|nr:hypothetical protein QBC35DRAFT_450803 [Podospora australis]
MASINLHDLVREGQYLDVLLSDPAKELIQAFVSQLQQTSSPTTPNESIKTTQEVSSAVGLAAFNAFLQATVTGPVLDDVPLGKVERLFAETAKDRKELRKQCLKSLEVDGVSPYAYVDSVELFSLARYIFSQSSGTTAWENLRVKVWHYKLLTQPTLGSGSLFNKGLQWCDVPTLQGEIEASIEEVDGLVDETDSVKWLVEKANVLIILGYDVKAREALKKATELNGFVYTLSGALAKRTKFQEKSTSHLVVLAKSREEATDTGKGSRPAALKLNDDTLLEELAFEKEKENGTNGDAKSGVPDVLKDLEPDNQPQLSPLDQIILLAEATLKDAFSPADTLTSEEVLPFAVRVINDKTTNWQVYTHALLVRSRIEVHRSRTIERGVLQMQAVVDQVVVDTTQPLTGDQKREALQNGDEVPEIKVTVDGEEEEKKAVSKPTSFFPAAKPDDSAPAQVRLEYIHALSSPPRWHLESELAYSWAGVGSLVSAMEIFKRLRLWAEVALCFASSAQHEDEGGRGKDGEAKARALIRWRLFHKTGSSADGSDPDEEGVELDDLKQSDYQGPERNPPPPNAPRLLCILGDLDNEPKYYERAWEISGNRFARAQKSLGEYYLQQKDAVKARDAYKKAVAVNRLSNELWSRLGDISLRLGEFQDAAEAFSRAISCSDANGGEDARTWSNLGSALYSLYVERVKELKQEGTKEFTEVEGDEENLDSEKPAKQDPKNLLMQSLHAYKKGASISHDNWRIWDNVITLASRLRPVAVSEVLLGLQHVVRIKNSEDSIDIDILRLLLNEAVLSQEKEGSGTGVYEPPRGSTERSVCEFLEKSIVPLITNRSEFWELIARERVWRRDLVGAVDATEKAWRAAMGGAGVGLLPSSAAADGKSRNWLEDKEAWQVVVERTDELVSILENYGEEVPEIGSKWKGKARLAVRSVMGKGKEMWEDTEEFERLKGLLEGLSYRRITYEFDGAWKHSELDFILLSKCGCYERHEIKDFVVQRALVAQDLLEAGGHDLLIDHLNNEPTLFDIHALGSEAVHLYHAKCFDLAFELYNGHPIFVRTEFAGTSCDNSPPFTFPMSTREDVALCTEAEPTPLRAGAEELGEHGRPMLPLPGFDNPRRRKFFANRLTAVLRRWIRTLPPFKSCRLHLPEETILCIAEYLVCEAAFVTAFEMTQRTKRPRCEEWPHYHCFANLKAKVYVSFIKIEGVPYVRQISNCPHKRKDPLRPHLMEFLIWEPKANRSACAGSGKRRTRVAQVWYRVDHLGVKAIFFSTSVTSTPPKVRESILTGGGKWASLEIRPARATKDDDMLWGFSDGVKLRRLATPELGNVPGPTVERLAEAGLRIHEPVPV